MNKNLFRKKPVVIEAVQYTQAVRDAYVLDGGPLPPGVYSVGHSAHRGDRKVYRVDAYINTLEGRMEVSLDDWIITGVKGEHYACKPDIFALTYEAVASVQVVPAEPSLRETLEHVIETFTRYTYLNEVGQSRMDDEVEAVLERAKADLAASPLVQAPQPLTDEQIDAAITLAVKTGRLAWIGYRPDENGRYTLPDLQISDYDFARAIEAAHGITSLESSK